MALFISFDLQSGELATPKVSTVNENRGHKFDKSAAMC